MNENFSKIIVISDTHMHLLEKAEEAVRGCYFPDQIYESQIFVDDENLVKKFLDLKPQLNNEKPDLIIHAGDVGYQNIVDILESIAPLKVVNGNCDFQTFRTIEGMSEDFVYFEFEGIKIALAHDPFTLDNCISGDFLHEAVIPEGEKPDLRIHGHTHESYINHRDDGTVTICPGSATMGRYGTPNSIAAVYIFESKIIAADLIKV